MPENFPRIGGSQVRNRPGGLSASVLPPAGNVVMATVEESLGDGLYSLRWGGNRVTVSSKTPLNQGETLIMKSESAPDGKPVLVVHGPAFPKGQNVNQDYLPTYSKPVSDGKAGSVAAATQSPEQHPSPAPGTTLKPILAELPDASQALGELLAAADEELQKAAPKTTDKQNSQPARDQQAAGRQETAAADRQSREPAAVRDNGENSSADAARGTGGGDKQGVSQARPDSAKVQGGTAEAQTNQTAKPSGSGEQVSALPGGNETPAKNGPQSGVQSQPDAENAAGRDAQSSTSAASTKQEPAPETLESPAPSKTPSQSAASVPGAREAKAIEIGPALVDAIEQIAKAAELPFGGNSDRLGSAATRNRTVPEAIADKAATILLKAAGLTPGPATLEAAKTLMRYNVQIDRQTVQTALALAGNAEEGERQALIQAAARLASHDVPMAAPLVGGLADILDRRSGISQLIDEIAQALAADPDALPKEAQLLLKSAGQLLELLCVDLESGEAGTALERFISTFGREALGKAEALLETATQVVLENHPQLPKIDAALTAVLTLLENEAAALPQSASSAAMSETGELPAAAPAVLPDAPQASKQSEAAVAELVQDSAESLPGQSGSNIPVSPGQADKAGSGGETSPVPGNASPPLSSETLVAASASGGYNSAAAANAAPGGQALPEPPEQGQGTAYPADAADLPETAGAQEGNAGHKYDVLDKETALRPVGDGGAALRPGGETAHAAEASAAFESRVLEKLKSLFQLPGVNSPEIEILKPYGSLDRLLSGNSAQPLSPEAKASTEQLMKELLGDNRERVETALKELAGRDKAQLRELASRLSELEQRTIRSDPALNRLADASSSLRDLGRQLIAIKAENLAGQEREPGVMFAEVPFKLTDQQGDGRMQMFYRRSKTAKGWSARVILDLNTTNMGPVLGDMRFFGQDMVLNLFVENSEIAGFLAEKTEELSEALQAKGFRLKPKFLVLPPPPPQPELVAEQPAIAGETAETVNLASEPHLSPGRRRRGRLDVKG